MDSDRGGQPSITIRCSHISCSSGGVQGLGHGLSDSRFTVGHVDRATNRFCAGETAGNTLAKVASDVAFAGGIQDCGRLDPVYFRKQIVVCGRRGSVRNDVITQPASDSARALQQLSDRDRHRLAERAVLSVPSRRRAASRGGTGVGGRHQRKISWIDQRQSVGGGPDGDDGRQAHRAAREGAARSCRACRGRRGLRHCTVPPADTGLTSPSPCGRVRDDRGQPAYAA